MLTLSDAVAKVTEELKGGATFGMVRKLLDAHGFSTNFMIGRTHSFVKNRMFEVRGKRKKFRRENYSSYYHASVYEYRYVGVTVTVNDSSYLDISVEELYEKLHLKRDRGL